MLTMRPSDATNSPSMISQPRPSSGSDQPSDSDPDRSQTQVQGQGQAQIPGQSLPFMLAPAKKKSHARKQSEDHVKRPRFVHPLPQSSRTVLMTKKKKCLHPLPLAYVFVRQDPGIGRERPSAYQQDYLAHVARSTCP